MMSDRDRKSGKPDVEEILLSIRSLIDETIRNSLGDAKSAKADPLVLTPRLRAPSGRRADPVLLLQPENAVAPRASGSAASGAVPAPQDTGKRCQTTERAPQVLHGGPPPDPATPASVADTADSLQTLITGIVRREIEKAGQTNAMLVRKRVRLEMRRAARSRKRR